MSDVPIKIRNEAIETLASEVIDHPGSPYDGEASQDDVIKAILEQELARLDDEENLSAEAEAAQRRLKADMLGLEEEELSDGDTTEELSEVEQEQNRLQEKFRERQKRRNRR